MHELEKKDLVIKFKDRRRKYYKITKDGKIFVEKYKKSLDEMRDRFRNFVGIMSQILDIKESELRRIIESHIKSQRSTIFMFSPSLRRSLFKLRNLILKIGKDKTKHKKLEKISSESND